LVSFPSLVFLARPFKPASLSPCVFAFAPFFLFCIRHDFFYCSPVPSPSSCGTEYPGVAPGLLVNTLYFCLFTKHGLFSCSGFNSVIPGSNPIFPPPFSTPPLTPPTVFFFFFFFFSPPPAPPPPFFRFVNNPPKNGPRLFALNRPPSPYLRLALELLTFLIRSVLTPHDGGFVCISPHNRFPPPPPSPRAWNDYQANPPAGIFFHSAPFFCTVCRAPVVWDGTTPPGLPSCPPSDTGPILPVSPLHPHFF